jgi:parallel beta-helix repeat protein
MNKKRFMLAILLISVVCLGSSAVFAEDAGNTSDNDNLAIENNDILTSSNHTISPGATSDDIQNTINSMGEGDVLNFENGTYSDICIYVNKSITINGNGATLVGYDTPSINNTPSIITNKTADGGYGISNLATLYVVNANNVVLNGLKIVGGANSASTYSNALVFVTNSHNLTFKNNTVDGSSWGVYIQYSHDGIYTENLIKNQAVTGLINFGSARTQIERNKVVNAKNHGIDVRHGTGPNVQVINNTVVGSQEGIYLMHSQGHTAAYNTLINCSISSISCYGSSNINLYNNTLQKSRIGILLGGGYKNITVGANNFKLNNLPFPPTFVYYIAEAQTDYGSATAMMGTHSDSSSYTPTYKAYTEIPTPKDINIDYTVILNETGTVFNVPKNASSSDIQKIIDSMKDGDSLKFEKDAVYTDISIYTDKNIKIFGNGATLIGYDNVNLTNVPSKITNTTANGGYGLANPAVLYSVNNSGVVISDLNIVSKYPGYEPLSTVPATSLEYKTVGIRAYESKNITITGCSVDGASWGIYLEYSGVAIVTNNEIKNQFTTGILNFGTPQSIIAGNTITNVANHGIDVRHGTGPKVTVFNNTITGAREGIYLMHSQGHNVYNNTVKDCSISGITAYGSGNENIFNNSISGSRIGILLGGGYYNVTIGLNTYDLDFLPFPPTFVTYLAKAENKYGSAEAAIGTYTTLSDTIIDAKDIETTSKDIAFESTLTTAAGKAIANQTVKVTINNVTYNATTDEKGVATVNTKLANGKYDVSMEYAGEGTYVKTIATSKITVVDSATTLTIDEVIGNGTIIATLKDDDEKGIADATITYLINDVKANVTTDENGQVKIDCGNNKISLVFEGTDNYLASENEITINITVPSPEPTPTPTPTVQVTSIITVNDITVLAEDEATIKVTLKDENGAALVNKTIMVIIDDKIVGVADTDANGTIIGSSTFDAAATHSIVVYYAGDNATTSSLDVAKITVNKRSTTLTAAKATLKVKKVKKITVTLKSSGKAVAGKKVTITVNKKTFTAKTNKNGKATISVKVTKKGKFTATVKFTGDSAYKAVTKKVKYTVK